MRRLLTLVIAVAMLSGCATVPDNAYYPKPGDPETGVVADALYRAARAASEEPGRYSFAMVRTAVVRAHIGDDATLYVSEGLARQPARVIDALVAHEIAHGLLGHVGRRSAPWASSTGGFTLFGVAIPGRSLLDRVANSSIVRAHTRDQEIAADQRAVEVLRDMGYQTPRRVLADALRAAAAINSAADRGRLASEPELGERLAALGPLEPVAITR